MKRGKISVLTISRPENLNALNSETLKELDLAINVSTNLKGVNYYGI
ncbi:MAG: hypothetical protein ACREVX_11600 [Clostridium sp.]